MENKQKVAVCPPALKREKYDLWKKKMMPFLKAINLDVVDIIESEIPTSLHDKGKLVLQNT